ncbi:NIPSNAP family protein [Arenibaculum pallidiluteum]|uniref:NIPSNAP family protein n=1 Tax=Arenibaculum pallidiluteum TaxID=2812559 RepID=UPI001A97BFA3|nr:NIPSNAP family protein [Arenibaculum pallidiluteum]
MAEDLGVVELRRYRLHAGAREGLIALFEREFVETQEAEGISLIGQFRDLDDADAFVWIRGFADMAARKAALAAFYGGPAWAAHREAANAAMINSENVLLLRPAYPGSGFPDAVAPRPALAVDVEASDLILATVCHLAPGTDGSFAAFFAEAIAPLLAEARAPALASFMVERSVNGFPRLPVREGETLFVWFSAFAGPQDHAAHLSALDDLPAWRREVLPEMERRVWRRNEVSRLAPTARSLLRGVPPFALGVRTQARLP